MEDTIDVEIPAEEKTLENKNTSCSTSTQQSPPHPTSTRQRGTSTRTSQSPGTPEPHTPTRARHNTTPIPYAFRIINLLNVTHEQLPVAHLLLDNVEHYINTNLTSQTRQTFTIPQHFSPLPIPSPSFPNLQTPQPSLPGTSPSLLGSYPPQSTSRPSHRTPRTPPRNNNPYKNTHKH